MCTVLMSIHPKYVKEIFNGSKKYEFRKTKMKNIPNKMIIYSTSPVMKVVGEATVTSVLEDTPDNIWKVTKEESGIDEKFYYDYYKDKEYAIAIELSNVVLYDEALSLSHFNVKSAPQSFQYL